MSGDMSSVPPDARGITTADDFRITSPASHVRVSLMGPDHLLRINDENGDPLVVVGRDGCVDMIAGVSYHEASRRFWEAMADVQMVRDAFARNPPEGWVVQQTIPLSKNPMWGTARLDDFTNTQPLPDGRINDLYSRIGGRVICNACNVQPDWPGEHRCFRDDAGSLLTCECPSMLCRLIREEVTVAELEAEDAAAAGPSVQPRYPYKDGDTLVLGPECFVMRDGSVLCWRGVNYVPQEVIALAGRLIALWVCWDAWRRLVPRDPWTRAVLRALDSLRVDEVPFTWSPYTGLTAASGGLDAWACTYGLSRAPGEDDEALRARLMAMAHRPLMARVTFDMSEDRTDSGFPEFLRTVVEKHEGESSPSLRTGLVERLVAEASPLTLTLSERRSLAAEAAAEWEREKAEWDDVPVRRDPPEDLDWANDRHPVTGELVDSSPEMRAAWRRDGLR